MLRRLSVFAIACAAFAVSADAASAAPACAFADTSPCLAKHSRVFKLWGQAPDASADDNTMSVSIEGFDGLRGDIKAKLADQIDESADVSLNKGGRFYFVNAHGRKRRVGASDIYGVLDAYPQATVYLTGRLVPDSLWDDDTPALAVSIATVDISDLNVALPDLSGDWNVNGGKFTTTLTQDDASHYTGSTPDGNTTFTVSERSASKFCISLNAPNPDQVQAASLKARKQSSKIRIGCGTISPDAQTLTLTLPKTEDGEGPTVTFSR